jgi:hypothetical protein
MSDENVPQTEDTVSRAEFDKLQEQLKSVKAERDRQAFEKSEIVAKANACASERDTLKGSLASAVAERDRLAGDLSSERSRLAAEQAALQAATRRVEELSAETARLRQIVEATPESDPVALLWAIVSEKTRAGVAWARAKIPADSPMLPWFDRTVETVTMIGCMAVKLTREFVAWATPRAIALSKQGVAKIEEMLAKK